MIDTIFGIWIVTETSILISLAVKVIPMPKASKAPTTEGNLAKDPNVHSYYGQRQGTKAEVIAFPEGGKQGKGIETAVDKEFQKVETEKAPAQANLPRLSVGSRLESTLRNVGNVAMNAWANTGGYFIAGAQNKATEKFYKKNPAAKDPIVYLMNGVLQNEGSQYRFAQSLEKKGHKPYHIKAHHTWEREKNAEEALRQIEGFQKKTGLKEPYKRSDYFSGHSSGADIGIYLAGDKRTRQYGIRTVQARAPAPHGVGGKKRTLGQMLLMPIASADDTTKPQGRANAVNMYHRKPLIDVHVIAGERDGLVRPQDALYKHAKSYKVIKHPDSTHFGTSGVNRYMNGVFVDEMQRYSVKEKKEEKRYEHQKAA